MSRQESNRTRVVAPVVMSVAAIALMLPVAATGRPLTCTAGQGNASVLIADRLASSIHSRVSLAGEWSVGRADDSVFQPSESHRETRPRPDRLALLLGSEGAYA